MDRSLKAIPGAKELLEWFGHWTSFHDAEVLSMEFNRTGSSKIRVHTFQITDQVDSRGYSILEKHCIVTFWLDEIVALELAHFNHQNAILGLDLSNEDGHFVITFDPAHGVEGTIKAQQVAIEVTPGIPRDSQYKNF